MKQNLTDRKNEKMSSVEPFLKWAGGKRWLIDEHYDLLSYQGKRLIEPFLGSGAVFFGILPKRAILSDTNAELIDTYLALKDDWKKVYSKLEEHSKLHCKDYYYKIRESNPRKIEYKAARFIYLNRTCWNGLYRVNKSNRFNVPIGSRTLDILRYEDFKIISKAINNAAFHAQDFEKTIDLGKKGDFIFADPPYTVNHNNNGFIKYNEKLFSWDDQIRLKDSLLRAADRGCKVVQTNANHYSIQELYKGIGLQKVLSRNSSISGKNSGRGHFEELLIII